MFDHAYDLHEYDSQEYRGYTIKVYAEECPDDPRDWEDFAGTFVFEKNRDYDLGGKTVNLDSYDGDWWERGTADRSELWAREIKARGEAEGKIGVIVPLYAADYGSGGMRLIVSEPGDMPDDSDNGYIYMTAAKVRQEYHCQRISKRVRERAGNLLVSEARRVGAWLAGEVFHYTVTDPRGEVIDSCGGYYGVDEVDYILSEARREVDAREAKREAKHQLAMLAGL